MSTPLDLREHARRLFFAYWPDVKTRQALIEATGPAVASIDGQPISGSNLHVTLAFLGRVPISRIPEIIRIGARGDYKPAKLNFDRLEYWPRPKVVAALADAVPDAGQKLVDTLWERLIPLGVEREERAWRPHFTLVRRVRRPPPKLTIPALPWTCDRLALVESVSGPDGLHYTPLAEWALGKS
ncbi:MAG: RNA 2',3'-cyclic phosphodiesterase [Steroidobacteraceae bacterium]